MKKRSNSARLAGIGFELAAAVAGFVLFGYWIGKYFGRAELGVVIGAVMGLIGGMYNLIRTALAASGGTTDRKRKSSRRSDS